MRSLRKRIVIRGEGDQLRVGSEVFDLDDRDAAILQSDVDTSAAQLVRVEIEDEGNTLWVVAVRGALPDPSLWSVGVSCPVEARIPPWTLTWVSDPGADSPELRVVLSREALVRILR